MTLGRDWSGAARNYRARPLLAKMSKEGNPPLLTINEERASTLLAAVFEWPPSPSPRAPQ
ncbi:MAG TPA: hypothetical protein VEK34_03830 [Methylocella sp.]|nr:hypothetical protein [Methylocella sp.]